MRPYAVQGAGAVGSALAAYLARRGHRVWVAAREAHVRALQVQGGIRAVSRSETFLAPVQADLALPPSLPPETVIFLTVQSPDVSDAVGALAPFASNHSLVTWQNGIHAEEAAAVVFPALYGGVVRFTATLLEPGEVRLRAPGQLILGRHPRGLDPLGQAIVDDLRAAGFEAAASLEIGADKALKLLVNLVSGPAVLLRRSGKEPALAAVQVALLEEALLVFAAHRIDARPASGLGQPLGTLLAHFRAGGSAPDTTGGIYNSTWQNLHHHRPRLENDSYHGEIVRLGKEAGVATPVNARALLVLESVCAQGLGPEPFDLETFRAKFADVVDFSRVLSPSGPEPPPGLEI
jgi:2-dehydropantoate 2-reductase